MKGVIQGRKGLFLDRDGVICRALPRGEYLVAEEQFELLPGIHELLAAGKEKGYVVIVVTNQGGALRKAGLDATTLARIHTRMRNELSGMIDAVYVCPHYKGDGCKCRKPRPGMLFKASRELHIDLARSIFVGDSDTDVLAGRAAGVQTVFLRNAYNAEELSRCRPDVVVDHLSQVIALLS